MNDLNIPSIPDDFDPFGFQCDHCQRKHIFTEDEIEKTKQKIPNTDNDYFILCQSCQKGHMQPPSLVIMSGLYQ